MQNLQNELYYFILSALLVLCAVSVLLFICLGVNTFFYNTIKLLKYIFKQFKQNNHE